MHCAVHLSVSKRLKKKKNSIKSYLLIDDPGWSRVPSWEFYCREWEAKKDLCKQKKWKGVISWRSASPSSLWETDKTGQKSGLSQYVSPTTYPSLPVQHGPSRQAFNTFSDAVIRTFQTSNCMHGLSSIMWPLLRGTPLENNQRGDSTCSPGRGERERESCCCSKLPYSALPLNMILCKIWCLCAWLKVHALKVLCLMYADILQFPLMAIFKWCLTSSPQTGTFCVISSWLFAVTHAGDSYWVKSQCCIRGTDCCLTGSNHALGTSTHTHR